MNMWSLSPDMTMHVGTFVPLRRTRKVTSLTIAVLQGTKKNKERREYRKVAANERTLCFTTTSSNTNVVDTQHTQQGLDTRQIVTDDRTITAEQLRGKVTEDNNMSPQQQEDLFNVLIKYQQHLTETRKMH